MAEPGCRARPVSPLLRERGLGSEGFLQPARKLALIVEYDGTCYKGFQFQANAPTIQGGLEKAIRRFTGEILRVKGASRTDAGVHAWGQVATVVTAANYSVDTWVEALNYYLPSDIKVKLALDVPSEFDARRHAASRVYRYVILNTPTPSPLRRRCTHWVREKLNVEAMSEAAGCLAGTHNFARFTVPSYGKRTVRKLLRWEVRRDKDLVIHEVAANAFLPQQVRRTAGALVEVGLGRLSAKEIAGLVEGRDDVPLPPLLPPQGLCLVKVNYRDFPLLSGEGHATE